MKNRLAVQPWQREYFSSGYKIAFLNAMGLRLQAGESAGRALAAVVNAEPNPAKKRDMAPALEALDQGEAVASAIGKLGFFDSTVLAILGSGERAGMREAISTAAAHLTLRQAWFRQHALVIFILANELFSAALAPVLLYTDILPWIREHITPPTAAAALLKYEADMAIAEQLTVGLIGLTVLFVLAIVINIYRITHLSAPTRILLFFSDGAMAVGFKLAAAMLSAGVTIENVARDLATQSPGWSRRYWGGVNEQLQLAVEPAQALMQQGIYPDEQSLLATHANARQLADTFLVLANSREQRAKRGRDLLLVGGTLLTIVFIFMTLGIAIWVYMTYDSTLSAGLDALGNGF
ncbi:MAG: type II secretion system F family protein [Azonexus sp.]|nr:type II secretion system F family protein [Azonexus sp.]MDZ4315098.1 type II secretion system F family protein [Azonexus sp.]